MNTAILPANHAERLPRVQRLARQLMALPEKRWRVDIKEHRPHRTDQQNRYLWGVCYPTILEGGGEQLAGWDKDDLHEFFLGEHFGWETLEGFGRKRMRPLRRSSKLNKQEFTDYVEFIQRRAAGLGIIIPDPEEV